MVVPLIFGAMLVKTKDYLEVQSVEAKSHPVKKSEEILKALRSDYEFVSNKGVKSALVRKETHWTELKNEGSVVLLSSGFIGRKVRGRPTICGTLRGSGSHNDNPSFVKGSPFGKYE